MKKIEEGEIYLINDPQYSSAINSQESIAEYYILEVSESHILVLPMDATFITDCYWISKHKIISKCRAEFLYKGELTTWWERFFHCKPLFKKREM